MKQILFATGNAAKVRRFKDKLASKGIELLSLKDLDISLDVEENGQDALENALIKARAYASIVDMPIMAMDDTLYLENVPESLQPKTYVRRVNGRTLSDDEMIEYYSNLAHEYGKDGNLEAKWVYGLVIKKGEEEHWHTWSKSSFVLVDKPSSIINPGYPLDSISKNIELNKYFCEMTKEDKEKVQEDESEVVDFIATHV